MLKLKRNVELLKLSKKNLERELEKKGYNSYDLAAYYINNFQGFNKGVKSDLRSDDTNNSLFARIQNGKLLISDFGYKTGMSIYDYINEKHFQGLPGNFYKVLELIRSDFRINTIERANSRQGRTKKPIAYNKTIQNSNLPVKIEVKRQKFKGNIHWSKEDIEYWKSYGISINKLESKGIAPLSKFWITNFNKDGIRKEFNVRNELCYVYPFFRSKEGFFMYKIYLPKGFKGNPDFRWISNVNKKVVQNIQHIPKSGDLLIIQSSFKDCMLMEELIDCNVVAPNGEGIWFDDETWYYIRKNWKNIILFGNNDSEKNDNPGLKFCKSHSEKYNIPFITTPDNTTSDISDYYKKYGLKKTQELLNNILTNIKLIV
jgi:hypothetical protein